MSKFKRKILKTKSFSFVNKNLFNRKIKFLIIDILCKTHQKHLRCKKFRQVTIISIVKFVKYISLLSKYYNDYF